MGLTGMCLLEPATSLRSCPSKLKVGNGENPGPATQRKESFTTTRFLEVQLQLLNLKSAVARKQKQEPARQNGPS